MLQTPTINLASTSLLSSLSHIWWVGPSMCFLNIVPILSPTGSRRQSAVSLVSSWRHHVLNQTLFFLNSRCLSYQKNPLPFVWPDWKHHTPEENGEAQLGCKPYYNSQLVVNIKDVLTCSKLLHWPWLYTFWNALPRFTLWGRGITCPCITLNSVTKYSLGSSRFVKSTTAKDNKSDGLLSTQKSGKPKLLVPISQVKMNWWSSADANANENLMRKLHVS